MGLTNQSTGAGMLKSKLKLQPTSPESKIIALAGNPNVGKSTIFNSLTGLKQHTGNWPGKTVATAFGKYMHKGKEHIIIDLPGTYSLMANSAEEQIATDFICFENPDATIVVTDATCLERNLNLVLQTIEITNKVVVCVNLMDEAKKKGIVIDLCQLSELLAVPVIGTNARQGNGLKELVNAVYNISNRSINPTPIKIAYNDVIEHAISIVEPAIDDISNNRLSSRWVALKLLDGNSNLLETIEDYLGCNITKNSVISTKLAEAKTYLKDSGINDDIFRDKIVESIVNVSESICNRVVCFKNINYNSTDRKIDKVITSKIFGIPIMLMLLSVIFWLTIVGANYPSNLIASLLFNIENYLTIFFTWLGTPAWVHGILVTGIYKTLAWVVSVMLPPMAIFFPLFTLLEDLGYLPRIAFNLDSLFKKACAHGKQALTMCMGFGCNAAGVIGCRIIESPRERLIAIITNTFVPCNGRFPMIIAIITMFFVGTNISIFQSIISAVILTSTILLGIVMTLVVSKILSKTILKGLPSSFALELPPYRRPQLGKIIIRSIFDRTLFVLGRAVAIAAPAGLVIWLMTNIYIYDASLLSYCAGFLNPFAQLIGMDGYILMAFILGFPANEIVIPIIIMSYMATGNIVELDNLNELKALLITNGWSPLTAICVMLFSLMHFPCGTTCWTIKKETQSWKWTLLSFFMPTVAGIVPCFIVKQIARVLVA